MSRAEQSRRGGVVSLYVSRTIVQHNWAKEIIQWVGVLLPSRPLVPVKMNGTASDLVKMEPQINKRTKTDKHK